MNDPTPWWWATGLALLVLGSIVLVVDRRPTRGERPIRPGKSSWVRPAEREIGERGIDRLC